MADQQVEAIRAAIRAAVRVVEEIPDPVERARIVSGLLAGWPGLHREVRQVRQRAVLDARAAGRADEEIAERLGVTADRVGQIARGQ